MKRTNILLVVIFLFSYQTELVAAEMVPLKSVVDGIRIHHAELGSTSSSKGRKKVMQWLKQLACGEQIEKTIESLLETSVPASLFKKLEGLKKHGYPVRIEVTYNTTKTHIPQTSLNGRSHQGFYADLRVDPVPWNPIRESDIIGQLAAINFKQQPQDLKSKECTWVNSLIPDLSGIDFEQMEKILDKDFPGIKYISDDGYFDLSPIQGSEISI